MRWAQHLEAAPAWTAGWTLGWQRGGLAAATTAVVAAMLGRSAEVGMAVGEYGKDDTQNQLQHRKGSAMLRRGKRTRSRGNEQTKSNAAWLTRSSHATAAELGR